MVIVSVGLVGLLGSMTSVTRNSADPMITKQMTAVAEGMLEEIELLPFGPGILLPPYNCATRPQFDAIPDYNGFTTAGAGVCDVNGLPVVPLASYNVAVTVVPAAGPNALGAIPPANAVLIQVTVTGPNGSTVTLSGYRTNYY